MNKKNYISIELKRKLKALPLLLLSTVILSIFIGIIAYIAFLYANDNKDVSKKKIVFIGKNLTSMAISKHSPYTLFIRTHHMQAHKSSVRKWDT